MTAATALMWLHTGALLHGVQLPATAALARGLRATGFLHKLPPLARAAMGVLAGGVVLAVLAGAVSLWLLPATALALPFARAQIIGWALFWCYRLLAQLFVYRRFVPPGFGAVHWLLAGLFATKTCCFGMAAWFGCQ